MFVSTFLFVYISILFESLNFKIPAVKWVMGEKTACVAGCFKFRHPLEPSPGNFVHYSFRNYYLSKCLVETQSACSMTMKIRLVRFP